MVATWVGKQSRTDMDLGRGNGVLLNGDQRLTIVQIDFRRTTDIILLRYGNLA